MTAEDFLDLVGKCLAVVAAALFVAVFLIQLARAL